MSRIRLKDDAPTAAQSVSAKGREASAEHTSGGTQQASGQRAQARNALRQHPYLTAATAIVVISALAGAVLWWLDARNYESSDDAFVDARNVSISSEVTGPITNVPVTDNQLVGPGGLLVQIDPRDYQDAVAQAQAQVDQANATIANLDAQMDEQKARIDQAEKQVVQAKAALTFAQQENARAQDLVRKGAGTQQQAQQTSSNLIQGQANVASAEANAIAAQKQIPVLETQRQGAVGQLEQAQATLAQAKVNLERTRIVAPERGRATKITAAVGANAQPGQVLMLFVPEYKWVTANYKETQLTYMRPGQPVDIEIDAYPNRRFQGHVESIQAGSGAAFSLLPPENATGNFVKVVQRVPVKIAFDEMPDVYIGPGMSIVPTVKVR
jgi:membrane fusion protein (multidrug efflux system)